MTFSTMIIYEHMWAISKLILDTPIAIAFFTIAGHKVPASVQRRKGPNVIGFWGIRQAFVDGLQNLAFFIWLYLQPLYAFLEHKLSRKSRPALFCEVVSFVGRPLVFRPVPVAPKYKI